MNIDFTQYAELKMKGALTAHKIGNRAVMFKRVFHAETGEELDPQTVPVNVKELHKALDHFAAQTAGITAFLADLQALGVDISKPAPKE